jgi:putative zinc finger protein
MNCHETRGRLSDLLDEALAAPERTEMGAHLDSCPDCRRELDRLRATVSLLARVERPRAPVGFVERVTAAASAVPWYRRLGRRLFLPLSIKVPAQAAAMLVVTLLGVYLLHRTPELRDAARPELQSPALRSEPSVTTPTPPAAPPAPAQKASKGGKPDSGSVSETVPRAVREREHAVRDGRRLDSPQSSPPSPQELNQDIKKEADLDRLQKSGAPTSQAAPAPMVAESTVRAPASPPAELRAKSPDAAEGQSGALAPAPPGMAAKRESAAPSVLGRLNVKSRPVAEQGLADLLERLGGSETGRRDELGATVVEVLVPVARYADFLSGLATLGSFAPEGQPVALPTEPPKFHLSIRIAE